MIVENFRMFFFLAGSEAEDGFHNGKPVLFGAGGGKGIAVSRLAFSREGAHQVFSGFAGIEISCHMESLSFFFYYNQNSLRLYF